MQRDLFHRAVLCFLLLSGCLMSAPARAVILTPVPLAEVLSSTPVIFMARVESVDPRRPALVLTVDEPLKGKAPFKRLAILLDGDAYAKRHNHTALLLERVAPRLPLVVFVTTADRTTNAYACTNGTWLQLTGVQTDDGLRWRFLHCEPYLRQTFKGTTAELRQAVLDGLSGKKKPPDPDTREKPGLGPKLPAQPEGSTGALLPPLAPFRERGVSKGSLLFLPSPPPRGRGVGGEGVSFLPPLVPFRERGASEGAKAEAPALPAKETHRTAGPPFAVIPTVLVGGPLAVLAMLFPAIFGGLTLVLRRWMVGLSIISLHSTLYLLHGWLAPRFLGSWWATPLALWLTMSALTSLGLLWAWRRHIAVLASSGFGPARLTPTRLPVVPRTPGWLELATLALLAVGCLALVIALPHDLLQLDLWGKTVWMIACGIWAALLHALCRLALASRAPTRTALPGEGIMLWAMLLAGLGFCGTFVSASPSEAPARPGAPYQVLWRFRLPVEGSWIASSPAVDGDRVYVGFIQQQGFATRGGLYCLDRHTGTVLWTFNDKGAMKPVFSTPCLDAGRVYVGEGMHEHAGCKLYCLDAKSGARLWAFETTSHTESSPTVAAGRVYCGAGDDGLYCLDTDTGEPVWHFEKLHVDARVLVADGRVYAGSVVGDEYRDRALFCLDAATGKPQWRLDVDLPAPSPPLLHDGLLYYSLGNGNFMYRADELPTPEKPAGAILCVRASTGERVWRNNVPDSVLAPPALSADRVCFVSRDHSCRAVDPREGTSGWKLDLGSPLLAAPTPANNPTAPALYVASSAGRLCRLDADTGTLRWQLDVADDTHLPAACYGAPVIAPAAGGSPGRLLYLACALNSRKQAILYCLEDLHPDLP